MENNKKTPKEKDLDINLLPVLVYLLHRIWIIVLVAVIAAVGTFFAAKILVKPKYQSGFTAYVNNQTQFVRDSLTSSDILASQKLVLTYSKILTSDTVLEAAANELGEDYTYDRLNGKISTNVMDETELIRVNVLASSPEEAYDIAAAVSKASPDCIQNIVEGSSMRIIDYPKFPTERYSPSYFRIGLLGGIIGAVLAAMVLIIIYIRDDTVKNEGDLEARFDIMVVGVIPDMLTESAERSSSYYYQEYGAKDDTKGDERHGQEARG